MDLEIVRTVLQTLRGRRVNLTKEKETQREIEGFLRSPFGDMLEREKHLSAEDIPDFFIRGVAIEVKIKGNKRAIYNQCVRYCSYPQVEALILITGIRMGFPEEINGKNCYVFNLSSAWL